MCAAPTRPSSSRVRRPRGLGPRENARPIDIRVPWVPAMPAHVGVFVKEPVIKAGGYVFKLPCVQMVQRYKLWRALVPLFRPALVAG